MHPKADGRGAGLASAHDAKFPGGPHRAFTRVQSGYAPVASSQITHSLPRRAKKFYRREARYQTARKNRRRVTVTPLSLDLSAHFTAVSSSCSNRMKRKTMGSWPGFCEEFAVKIISVCRFADGSDCLDNPERLGLRP